MTDGRRTEGSLALEEKQPRVIVIEARERPEAQKLRVAAYARVSSGSDDQLNSYAAQVRYFTSLIVGNEKWTLADIYADEAVTGTSAEKREDFQRLLADCRRGKVDRIITKSVSRFARNTRECLETIRALKNTGVSVYFEEQGIDTANMTGELLTAVFAGLAQAESESISKNMRWSYQKRMQSGSFNTCKYPFGYRLKDGTLEICEPEAEIVRMIFNRFLSGEGCEAIAEQVTATGYATRDNKPYWQRSTISYILRNERYAGDALLQKRYSTDTLPYQKKLNQGQREQYLVPNSHPPIISRETFDAAQSLIQNRAAKIATWQTEILPLSGRVICGNCGAWFKKKRCNGKTYWVCRTHHKNITECSITQILESEIYDAFLRMYHKLKLQGGALLKELISNLTKIRDRQMLWSVDIIELNRRICDIMDQDRQLSELNSLGLADPDFFILHRNELAEQLRDAKLKKERLLDAKGDNTLQQSIELSEALDAAPDFLDAFSGEWFDELVNCVVIESNEMLRFRLKNGLELTETIERTVR